MIHELLVELLIPADNSVLICVKSLGEWDIVGGSRSLRDPYFFLIPYSNVYPVSCSV